MVTISAHEVEEGLEAYRAEFPDDYRQEAALADAIQAQDHVTKEQLVEIVKWKLAGQGGRSNLNVGRFADVPAGVIENITRAAFLMDDPKTQVKILSAIPGIGFATATVILAFRDPERYAVGDRIINEVVFGEEEEVTPTNYPKLLGELGKANPGGYGLRQVEKALYMRLY